MADVNVSGSVNIVLQTKGTDGVIRNLEQTEKKVVKTTKQISVWQRAVVEMAHTAMKAIASMIAIMAIMTIVITPVVIAFQTITAVIGGLATKVSDLKERLISIQAILGSIIKFADTFEKSYQVAGEVADKIVTQLMLRSKELIGSFEDATIVLQVLLATGGTKVVKTWQELVDLTILFTNAIITVTPGQEKQRQLASETAALMSGQVRSIDRLANLLGLSGATARRFNEEIRKGKDGLAKFTALMRGFVQASKDYENLIPSIWDSIKDAATVIAKAGGEELYKTIAEVMLGFQETLLKNSEAIAVAIGEITHAVITLINTFKHLYTEYKEEWAIILKVTGGAVIFFIHLIAAMSRFIGQILGLIKFLRLTVKIFTDFGDAFEKTQKSANKFFASITDSWEKYVKFTQENAPVIGLEGISWRDLEKTQGNKFNNIVTFWSRAISGNRELIDVNQHLTNIRKQIRGINADINIPIGTNLSETLLGLSTEQQKVFDNLDKHYTTLYDKINELNTPAEKFAKTLHELDLYSEKAFRELNGIIAESHLTMEEYNRELDNTAQILEQIRQKSIANAVRDTFKDAQQALEELDTAVLKSAGKSEAFLGVLGSVSAKEKSVGKILAELYEHIAYTRENLSFMGPILGSTNTSDLAVLEEAEMRVRMLADGLEAFTSTELRSGIFEPARKEIEQTINKIGDIRVSGNTWADSFRKMGTDINDVTREITEQLNTVGGTIDELSRRLYSERSAADLTTAKELYGVLAGQLELYKHLRQEQFKGLIAADYTRLKENLADIRIRLFELKDPLNKFTNDYRQSTIDINDNNKRIQKELDDITQILDVIGNLKGFEQQTQQLRTLRSVLLETKQTFSDLRSEAAHAAVMQKIFADSIAEVRKRIREHEFTKGTIPTVTLRPEIFTPKMFETFNVDDGLIERANAALRRFNAEAKGLITPLADLDGRFVNLRERLQEAMLRMERMSAITGRDLPADFDKLAAAVVDAFRNMQSNALDLSFGQFADAFQKIDVNLQAEKLQKIKDIQQQINDLRGERDAHLSTIGVDLSGAGDEILKLSEDLLVLENSFNSFTNKLNTQFAAGLKSFLLTMKTLFEQVVLSIGQGLAEFFSALFAGEDATASFRKFVGNVIVMFGQLAVSLGTIALIASAIPMFAPLTGGPIGSGAAIGLIAAGVAAIALGTLLGGSGGGAGNVKPNTSAAATIPEFSFNQATINPQLGANNAIRGLAVATENLNNTISSLSSKSSGVLVKEGLKQNGGLIKSANTEANRRPTSGFNLMTSLVGVGNTQL